MKRLLLAAVLFFAPAGAAHAAAPVRMVVRDVLPQPSRTLASATPRFNLVGAALAGARACRGSAPAARGPVEPLAAGGRRLGGRHAGLAAELRYLDGGAEAIQWRMRGQVSRVREYLLWSPPGRRAGAAATARGLTGDHHARGVARGRVDRAEEAEVSRPTLKLAVVHHTATTNAYSCAQSAAIVRGIERYHVQGKRLGRHRLQLSRRRVRPGVRGALGRDRAQRRRRPLGRVQQGHRRRVDDRQLRTVGSSQAQQDALVKLLAWRLDVGHVDPRSTVAFRRRERQVPRRQDGEPARDLGVTATPTSPRVPGPPRTGCCPRSRPVGADRPAEALRADRLGAVGGPVHFAGTLSSSLPWTITVSTQRARPSRRGGASAWTSTGPGTRASRRRAPTRG